MVHSRLPGILSISLYITIQPRFIVLYQYFFFKNASPSILMSLPFLRTPISSPFAPRLQLSIFSVSCPFGFKSQSTHVQSSFARLHNHVLRSILHYRPLCRLSSPLRSASATCSTSSRCLVLQALHHKYTHAWFSLICYFALKFLH